MIIVLFHALYLFGKFVYLKYCGNEKGIFKNAMTLENTLRISENDFQRIDPEAYEDYTHKSIRFNPPAYVQRYQAVQVAISDPRYHGKIRKVVDFGCADLGFLVYLKNTVGVEEIICVDVDRNILEWNADKASPLTSEYLNYRARPLVIELCEGSVTDRDRKLEKTDAVTCIELIEHLYPETLTNLPFNIFGYIHPKVVIITTPNADFNVLFPHFSGFRHPDHKFEWTREQFQDWAENIVTRYPDYEVTFHGICDGPQGTDHLGSCTQMAVFHRHSDKNEMPILGLEGIFKTITSQEYPYHVDNRSDEQKILDEASYHIRHTSFMNENMEEEVPLTHLLKSLGHFSISLESLRTILDEGGWTVVDREGGPVVVLPAMSTFSDLSEERDVSAWTSDDYITNDDDELNDEDSWFLDPGPPVRDAGTQPSIERWFEEKWDDEPRIVAPENASELETTLGGEASEGAENLLTNDEARISEGGIRDDSVSSAIEEIDVSSGTRSVRETGKRNIIFNSSLQSNTGTQSANKLSDFGQLCIPLTSPPCRSMLDPVRFASYAQHSATGNDSMLNNTFRDFGPQSVNCTLDFEPEVSISCLSTSPDPLLSDSICLINYPQNSSTMENDSMLNNTFRNFDMASGELDSSSRARPAENDPFCAEYITESQCETANLDNFVADNEPRFTSSPRLYGKSKASNADDPLRRIQNTTRRSIGPNLLASERSSSDASRTCAQSRSNVSSRAASTEPDETHKEVAGGACTSRAADPKFPYECAKETDDSHVDSGSRASLPALSSSRNSDESACRDVCSGHGAAEAREKNLDGEGHSPDPVETPPNSCSPEIMDSGYPNSASAPDMTPEYDLSSIAQDQIPDSESPSVAEAPRLLVEPVEVENGDLANNNRDGEGNNMIAAEIRELDELQPLIDGLENDLENENDIYALENGFPVWLLRIVEMANPGDDGEANHGIRNVDRRDRGAGDVAAFVNVDRDEGFSSSSDDESNMDENEADNEDDNGSDNDDNMEELVNADKMGNDLDNDSQNANESGSGGKWDAGVA